MSKEKTEVSSINIEDILTKTFGEVIKAPPAPVVVPKPVNVYQPPVQCEYPTVDDEGRVHNPPLRAPAVAVAVEAKIGGEVEIVRGVKYAHGTFWRIFWIGADRYRANSKVYGIEDSKGNRGFVPEINCRIVR